jgi:hypothetical protein
MSGNSNGTMMLDMTTIDMMILDMITTDVMTTGGTRRAVDSSATKRKNASITMNATPMMTIKGTMIPVAGRLALPRATGTSSTIVLKITAPPCRRDWRRETACLPDLRGS